MAAKHPEPITNLGWFFLIITAIIIDALQAALNAAAGAGVLVNRIIDVGVAFSLLLIFYLKDIPLTPVQYGSIAAAFVGEEIPALDTLPMWTADVIYICASIKGQEIAEKAGVVGKVAVMALKAAKKGQGGDLMSGKQGTLPGADGPALPPPVLEHLPTNTVDLRPSGKV